jgi:hypothetical protein
VAHDSDDANRVESLALTAVFAAVSFGLLLLLPVATRSGPASAGWWTQPWLMPGIALGLLAAANAISLWRALADLRASPPRPDEIGGALSAMRGWLRPLEFFVYFFAYILALGRAGYFLSTLVFIQFLLWRTGLRSPRWIVAGLGAALAMTVVFRWGLGIWVPTADLYGLLPDAPRKFLTTWF